MHPAKLLPLTRWTAAALLLGALGVAQDTPGAQVEWARKFGVDDFHGQLRLHGKAGLEAKLRAQVAGAPCDPDVELSAGGGVALDVHFLGELREVAGVEIEYVLPLGRKQPQGRARSDAVGSASEARARSHAARGPGELEKTVRLCGFTVRYEAPGAGRSDPAKKPARLGPKELLPRDAKLQLMVGPVPLLIRANAGAGLESGVEPFADLDGAMPAVGIAAQAGAYLNGWVSAGVGGGCGFASVCAGVKGDLRLADFRETLRLGFDLVEQAPKASLGYELLPARLRILAIARFELNLGFFRIRKSFERLLHEWRAKAITGTVES